MSRYLISFDAHAMDHIPTRHPCRRKGRARGSREALNAGVWVFGGGLENQKATVVSSDGTVSEGAYPEAIGGFCVDRRSLARRGAGVGCQDRRRLPLRARSRMFMPDPAVGN
jgi:hypothetical protein